MGLGIRRLGLRVGAEGLRVRKGHRTSASGDGRNCHPLTWSLITVFLVSHYSTVQVPKSSHVVI